MTSRRYAVAMIVAMAIIVGLTSAAFFAFRNSNAYRSALLVGPGPFHGVHGLSFGADGTLYAADLMGMRVHTVDIETGRTRVLVGPPQGMADDVAVAPAGSPFAGTVVWTAIAVGKVYAREPNGSVREVAANLPSINTVGFSPDGRLFATQIAPGAHTLWQLDLTPAAKGGKPPEKIWDETGGLNGFVITSDGFLYGPQGDEGRIIRLNLATREVTVIVQGLKWPTGVKMDSKGTLYAVDLEAGTVHRIDKSGGGHEVIATLEPGLDNLAIGPDDRVYVSSITRNGVFVVDPATKAVRAITAGGLTAPGGVTVAGSGPDARVYVADLFTLREVDPVNGTVRTVIPMTRDTLYPAAVRAAGEDALIVTSWFTGRLQLIARATGAVLREEKGLAAPHEAVMLNDGTLVVTEAAGRRVTRIAADGTRTTVPGTYSEPVGLAVSGDTLFVSDAWNGSVVKVDLKTGSAAVLAQGFGRAEGLAVDRSGRLLLVDSLKKTLYAIDPATGEADEVATALDLGLEGPAPLGATWIHNGVAVGPDGVVYLPSDTRAALYTLTPEE
jgi:sugar lactone lactonase YvrE